MSNDIFLLFNLSHVLTFPINHFILESLTLLMDKKRKMDDDLVMPEPKLNKFMTLQENFTFHMEEIVEDHNTTTKFYSLAKHYAKKVKDKLPPDVLDSINLVHGMPFPPSIKVCYIV